MGQNNMINIPFTNISGKNKCNEKGAVQIRQFLSYLEFLRLC